VRQQVLTSLFLLPFAIGVTFAQTPAAQPPSITGVNATGHPVAPGSLGAIFGTNFAAEIASPSTVALSTIESVNPPSATAGIASLLVTITGSGFTSSTSAQLNGLSLSTTFVNSTTLTAQIPASDLLNPGTAEITVVNAAGATSNSFPLLISASLLQFIPVPPCRIIDTRNPNGPLGGPFVAGGTTRTIPIPSSSCNVPATASAYSLNFTVVPHGTLAFLTVWAAGLPQPVVSTLNSLDGQTIANAAIVPAGTAGAINAFADNDTDLIVDINGYFAPPATSTLQFYPLTPCRVLDTRNAAGTFGGPSIAGGTSRSFPIQASSCGVPAKAAAYSFNTTVVPPDALAFLTVWPTGQPQPVVSTLNSFDGTTLANAAIVPAGTGGAVSFFASDTTDLVVDINGYFAPPGTGGLNFYPVTPCRLVDTRNVTGTFGGPTMAGNTTRVFPLSQGTCGLPPYPTAQAYSLNMTVVPQGALAFLSTWPDGSPQPVVSTLNAFDGQVVANAAIVPAGTDGSIDVYVTNTTDVIIDTNGYFGP
jgi:IPT/TIG domain